LVTDAAPWVAAPRSLLEPRASCRTGAICIIRPSISDQVCSDSANKRVKARLHLRPGNFFRKHSFGLWSIGRAEADLTANRETNVM
jgi:hypothetical protein